MKVSLLKGSPRFVAGTVLALLGLAGLYVFQLGEPSPRFKIGVLLAIVGAIGWGGYVAAIKYAVRF